MRAEVDGPAKIKEDIKASVFKSIDKAIFGIFLLKLCEQPWLRNI